MPPSQWIFGRRKACRWHSIRTTLTSSQAIYIPFPNSLNVQFLLNSLENASEKMLLGPLMWWTLLLRTILESHIWVFFQTWQLICSSTSQISFEYIRNSNSNSSLISLYRGVLHKDELLIIVHYIHRNDSLLVFDDIHLESDQSLLTPFHYDIYSAILCDDLRFSKVVTMKWISFLSLVLKSPGKWGNECLVHINHDCLSPLLEKEKSTY